MFLLVQSSDHITPLTGASPTVTLSKAGGSFASPSGAVTEVANGWYKVAGNATDTDTLGPLVLHATAASADPVDVYFDVVAFNPQSSTSFMTGINGFSPPTNWSATSIDGSGAVKSELVKVAGVDVDTIGGSGNVIFRRDAAWSTVSATDIVSSGAINTSGGAVSNVTTVGSVTDISNISSAISSAQSDIISAINALNQSASRRIVLATSPQFERPESGSTNFQIEVRTYDGDGAATDADSTPTITATGIVSGDLSGNLGAVSNPATGVYRVTYNVESTDAIEQIRFEASATISSSTFTITAFAQVADFVAATFTTADRALLQNASDDTDTLVSRLTAQRALNLDNLDAAISSRASASALQTVDDNVDAILADTNELQTDWHDGGRLDLILDSTLKPTTPGRTLDVLADGSVNTIVGGNTNGTVGLLALGQQFADDAAIQADVAKWKGDVPLDLVGGKVQSTGSGTSGAGTADEATSQKILKAVGGGGS